MHSGALTRLATRGPAVLSFLAMRPIRFILCVFAAWAAGSMRGAEGAPQIGAQNESIGNEVQLALDRGFEFAAARQNPDGSWGNEGERRWVTPLILLAWSPTEKAENSPSNTPKVRGIAALRTLITHPPVEVRTVELAAAWLALERAQMPGNEELLRESATRLMSRQIRDGKTGVGGFGATIQGELAPSRLARLEDLPLVVLALRQSELVLRDQKEVERCIARTIGFAQSCADPETPGAYFSQPRSIAGPPKAAVSVGATAAALFALLRDAPPAAHEAGIQRALTWLGDHYSGKNGGSSLDDLLLAMALDAGHVSQLELRGGGKADWARDFAERAINAQNSNGSWPADPESPPANGLTSTACHLLMLRIIHRSL